MIQTTLNILLIVLGFGVLIFIHELGHFLAAKWAGIRAEAFAVGMGPVALAWRRGIGLRFGSTAPEYEQRVRAFLATDDVQQRSEDKAAELPRADFYRVGDKLGLGETEYSLRWLPIGGFVKMLGQEDANPNYVSDDPRSYNMRPIGKRMVVVSAGVIMNLILAIVLFVIAFVVGVRFPAPVVGEVAASLPAGRVMPENAATLGITTVGLQPGDHVLSIDGDPARTFADVRIASAMSKPGDTLTIVVQRPGVQEPLTFRVQPEKDPIEGLLGIGIAPSASSKLTDASMDDGVLGPMLEQTGLAKAGVMPGMTLISVNSIDITAYEQVNKAARDSNGEPLRTKWAWIDKHGEQGSPVSASLSVSPDFEQYMQREDAGRGGDGGLIGFSPLTRFVRVVEGTPNAGIIQPGDVLVRLADVPYPRRSQLFETLDKHRRKDISMVVLRDGEQVPLTCKVNRDGQLQVQIESALDLMITAQPVKEYARYRADEPGKAEDVVTPAGRLGLFTTGGTTIVEVAGAAVANWSEFRAAILGATRNALQEGTEARVDLRVQHPIAGSPRETVSLELTPDEVKRLHELKWHVDLQSFAFEPLYTVRQGSPLQAVVMGFEETHKMVMMTYLTIDRLFRGSVGVDQLRGPVGIVHIGTKVAREGLMYLLFFLGMISVNLAVINFLPLPIVDGGLFLFLVYEKIKGRPPSLAFQNVATVVGLLIIGSLFVVTFYNDVLRLFN